MTAKQNIILFIGIILIILNMWFRGQWSVLWSGIFESDSNDITGANGSGIPPPTGISKNPGTGKCPPGYISAFGKCWSPGQNPIPPSGGGYA